MNNQYSVGHLQAVGLDFGTKSDCYVNNLKNLNNMYRNIAAAGFNVQTPIVKALIGNLTGTLPTRRELVIRCEACNCELSSEVMLEIHVNGYRHRKKLKALDIISKLKKENREGVLIGDSGNSSTLRCELCHLSVNSPQQLEFHLLGAKHKRKVTKSTRSNVPSSKVKDPGIFPNVGKKKK